MRSGLCCVDKKTYAPRIARFPKIEAQRKRVRSGREEQRRERTMSFLETKNSSQAIQSLRQSACVSEKDASLQSPHSIKPQTSKAFAA